MNILIIEDEELAAERLSNLLQAVAPQAQIRGIASSILGAVKWLQEHPEPDLIFMDIELTDGQSFDIFNHTEVCSPVIFVTSYDEYAIKAFKVNSIDYLLKPVDEEDLAAALKKYHRLQHQGSPTEVVPFQVDHLLKELRNHLGGPPFRSRFLIRQGQQWIAVETKDTAYFFAQGRLTYLFTWSQQKYILDYTLEELETMLDPVQFFRVNRSYLVHSKAISQIHNYFKGKLKLILKPCEKNTEVLVSKERAAAFKAWMGK